MLVWQICKQVQVLCTCACVSNTIRANFMSPICKAALVEAISKITRAKHHEIEITISMSQIPLVRKYLLCYMLIGRRKVLHQLHVDFDTAI